MLHPWTGISNTSFSASELWLQFILPAKNGKGAVRYGLRLNTKIRRARSDVPYVSG